MWNSAKEYADLVKIEEYEYSAEPDDLEVRKSMLSERYSDEIIWRRYDPDFEHTPTETKYQHIISGLMVQFCATLSDGQQINFLSRFYWTTIDNRHMFARIKRSPDMRFYALFVSSSLITILTKLGKLELALHYPEYVLSCSRFPEEKVTKLQVAEMLAEVYIHFRETKLPLGPLIILDKRLDFLHFLTLSIQENLLIFHEMAHFLNGDLEDDCANQKLSDEYPNLSYQREYYADFVGFGLLLRQQKYMGKVDLEERFRILLALIKLFKVQNDLNSSATENYPHPLDRLAAIVKCYYGDEVADLVVKLIKADKLYKLSTKTLPAIVSREEKFEEYIEQKIKIAFSTS
jgi:hypothetical protein